MVAAIASTTGTAGASCTNVADSAIAIAIVIGSDSTISVANVAGSIVDPEVLCSADRFSSILEHSE